MRVVGVLLIGIGAYCCWYAWESHKNKSSVTPITDAKSSLSGLAPTPTKTAPSNLVGLGGESPAQAQKAQNG